MWIDDVRDALKWLIHVVEDEVSFEEAMDSVWQARKALAAIPDEHEMIGLLRWLEHERDFKRELMSKTSDDPNGSIYSTSSNQRVVLEAVIGYIEHKFGYKLPEEK